MEAFASRYLTLFHIVFIMALSGLHCAYSQVRGLEGQLVNLLLQNYSKYTRPLRDPTQQINVTVLFSLRQIESLDERHQVLSSFGVVSMIWSDEFLKWNRSEHFNMASVIVPAHLIWLPEIYTLNSVTTADDISLRRSQSSRAEITNDGTVIWNIELHWSTSCSVNLIYFPFDTQHCSVKMVSWVYKDKIAYKIGFNRILLSAYTVNNEWRLVSTSASSKMITYRHDFFNIKIPQAMFTVSLRRYPTYFIITMLIPCVTLSLLSALMFCIPPESGERVSYGVSILLSYSIFMVMVADVTPRGGEGMPYMLIYLSLSMAITAIFLSLSIMTINLHARRIKTPLPPRFQSFVFNYLSYLVCVHGKASKRSVIHPASMNKQNKKSNKSVTLEEQNSSDSSENPPKKQGHPRHNEDDWNKELTKQWHVFMVIMDRFLFGFSFSVTLISSVGLIMLINM